MGQPPAQPPGQPPYGPPTDYMYGGGGGPRKPRNNRKIALGVGAVVAAAAIVGGGAFAAASLIGGGDDDGPEVAEALPSSTFAFASVDLSKAGGALTLIKKFPGLADEAGASDLGSGDDLQEKLVGQLLGEAGDACGGLSWEKDFAPWLGHSAAIAGVDLSGTPAPVGLIQSTDDGKAKAEVDKLSDCAQGHLAGEVKDGWVVISTSQDVVSQVDKATDAGSLADDKDYQDRMGAIGDQGALTFYAGPHAGELLSSALDKYGDMLGSLTGSSALGSDSPYGGDIAGDDPFGGMCPGLASGGASGLIDSYKTALKSFGGAAGTLRFEDGGVELESATDFGKAGGASDEAGGLVGSLPSDTAAAIGISVGDDWFEQALASFGSVCGGSFDASKLEDELSQMTGMSFPDDIDTLLGDGFAVAVGKGIDFDAPTPAGQPIGAKIKGDADGIQGVLAKIRAKLSPSGQDEGMLDSDKSGDTVAVGPDADYRKDLLSDGGLSSDATFKDVVPDADKASAIVYVRFDDFDSMVERDGSSDDLANFKPLKALGISGWYDGTTAHTFLRLSTD